MPNSAISRKFVEIDVDTGIEGITLAVLNELAERHSVPMTAKPTITAQGIDASIVEFSWK